MEAYLLDWINLLLRWLHLIAGVAWIGASFYFVMLDSSLSRPARPQDAERGVSGELWAVHGGGVYQSQKYLLGPVGEPLAAKLHWSKWEAYTTWLSGMGLLVRRENLFDRQPGHGLVGGRRDRDQLWFDRWRLGGLQPAVSTDEGQGYGAGGDAAGVRLCRLLGPVSTAERAPPSCTWVQ